MSFEFDPATFMMVIFIDIVLSGDNAIVIGMAAAGLAPQFRQRAIVWGIAAAVVLRLIFAVLALYLLQIVGLKLVGGLLLFYVCWQMWRDIRRAELADCAEIGPDEPCIDRGDCGRGLFLRAVTTILIADVSMSLDNVLAVAAAARDNAAMLIFGLALSIVLMAVGATLIARLLDRHRWLAYIGLAVIVYVAGDMGWRGLAEVMAAMNGSA